MITSAMRLFTIALAAVVLTELLLPGYASARDLESVSADQASVRIGQEFAIKVGQELKLEDADLQVKFVAVSQDSRCPANVNCIWAGQADVVLNVKHNNCTSALTLSLPKNTQASDEGKVGGFRLRLVKLDPYPRTEQKISPNDYRASLIVTKD